MINQKAMICTTRPSRTVMDIIHNRLIVSQWLAALPTEALLQVQVPSAVGLCLKQTTRVVPTCLCCSLDLSKYSTNIQGETTHMTGLFRQRLRILQDYSARDYANGSGERRYPVTEGLTDLKKDQPPQPVMGVIGSIFMQQPSPVNVRSVDMFLCRPMGFQDGGGPHLQGLILFVKLCLVTLSTIVCLFSV